MGDPKEKQIRQYYIDQGYEGQALDDAVKNFIEYQANQAKQTEQTKQTVEPPVAKGGNNQISNIKINPENKDEAFVEFSAPPIKVPELVNGDLPDIKERQLFYTQDLQKKGFKGEDLQKRLDFALNRDRDRYNQKVEAANKQIQDSQPKPVANKNKGGWGDETDDWALTSLAKNAWNNALIPLINNLGSIPEIATNFVKTGYNLQKELTNSAENPNASGIVLAKGINNLIDSALPYIAPATDLWEDTVEKIGRGWNMMMTPLTDRMEFDINPASMNPLIKPSKGYTEETFSLLDLKSWEVDSFGKWAGSVGQGIGSTGSIISAAGLAKLASGGKVSPALAAFMAGSLTETNGIMQNLMENHDMSREEAMAIAAFAGPIIGTVDVLFGIENIAAKGFFREIVEDEILKTLKGYAGKKLVASQFQEIGKAIGRGVTKRITPKLLNSAVQMGVESVTEGAQSGIEKGIYQLVDNYLGYEKKTGEKLFDKVMSGDSLTGFELNAKAYVDMINEAAIGGIASGPFTAIHMMTSPSEQQTLFGYIESQVRSGKDPRGRLTGLIDDPRAGLDEQEKAYARENMQEMYNVAEAFKGVKGTADGKFQMYSLAKEKIHLQNKIKEFQTKEQELASRIAELEELVNNPPVPPTMEEVAAYQAQNAAAVAELAQRQAEYEQHIAKAEDINLYSENIALVDSTAKNVAKTGTVDIAYETNKKTLEEKYKKATSKPADSTATPAEEKVKKKSKPAWKAERGEGYMRGRMANLTDESGVKKPHIKDDDGDWFAVIRKPGKVGSFGYVLVEDTPTIKALNDIFGEETVAPVETPPTGATDPIITPPPVGMEETPVAPATEPIVAPPPAPAKPKTKYSKPKDVVLTEGETHAITFLDEESNPTEKSITVKQKLGNQYIVEDESGSQFLVDEKELQNDIFEQDQSGASADFGTKYTPTNKKKPAPGKKEETKPKEETPTPKDETKAPAADTTKEDEVRARIAEKKARLKKLNDERNAPKIADDPERNAQLDVEMLKVATDMIGDYIELGKIKFNDIVNDIIAEDGRNFAEQIFNYIKKAYAAYYTQATDDIADQMDDPKTVRSSKFEDFGVEQEDKPAEKAEEQELYNGSEIPTWHREFERAKRENDLDAIEVLYNKIKVVQNGMIQGRIKDPVLLEKTINELNDLKRQIEEYANSKKPKAEKLKTEKSAIPTVGEKNEDGEYAYNTAFHEAVDNNTGDVIVGTKEFNMPLADGDTIQYSHVVADAALILPSHDPRGHTGIGVSGALNVASLDLTEGYPERDGKSANSREYNTPSVIRAMFEHGYNLIAEYLLGSKTASNGEPIITDDGVVISGNSRMMSIWIAIQSNKDKKTKVSIDGKQQGVDGNYDRYLAALKEEIVGSPAKYAGITVEQIDDMVAMGKHPVLVKKSSNIKQYSKTEFDRYNQDLMQSKTEEERAKTIKDAIDSATPEQKRQLSDLFYMVDDNGVTSSMKDILSSKQRAKKIADVLSDMGLMSKSDYAKFLHNDVFNNAGIEHVTSILRGIVLTDETLEVFLDSKVEDEFGLKHFVKNIERALPALLFNYLIEGDANIVDWLIAAVQLKTYHYNQGATDNYISVPKKRGIEQKDDIDGFVDMRIRQSKNFPTGDANDVFFGLMENEANRLFVTAFFAAANVKTTAFASKDLTKLVQAFNNEHKRSVGERILEETANIFSDTNEDIFRKEALDAIETMVSTYYPQLLQSKIADPNTSEQEKAELKKQADIYNKKIIANIYDNLIKQGLSIAALEKFARDTFGRKSGSGTTEQVSTKDQKDSKGQEKTDRGNAGDTDAGTNQSDKSESTKTDKGDQADTDSQGREPKSGTGTGETKVAGTDSTKQADDKTGTTENQEKSSEIDNKIDSKVNAIKDILGDILNPNKIGIYNDPRLDAEQNIKLAKLVTELIPLYLEKGYYTFKEMFLGVYNTYGEQVARILHPFLADSYMGYQTQIDDDAILDKMQTAREIKKETADKLISESSNADKIDEQTKPPTHRESEEKAIAENKKARAYNGDTLNQALYSFEEEMRVAAANNETAANEKLKAKTSLGVVEVSFDKAKDRLAYKKEDDAPLTPNEIETLFVEIVQGKAKLTDGSGTTVFAPKETVSNNEAQAQYRAEVREALKKDRGVSKDIADDTISVESVYKMADKAGVMPADFHKNIKQAILDKTGYTAETYSEILKKQTNEQEQKTDKGKQGLRDESKPSSGGAVRGNPSSRIHPERPPIVYAAKNQIPTPEKQIKDNEYTYLDEHQRFGVNLILTRFFNKARGFFLADGPGVGKTAILLAVAHVMSKRGKVLIVTQSKDIINDSFKDDAIGLGIDPKKSGITITTYNDIKTLDKDGNMKYSNTEFELVIYDESHKLKNSHTGTAIASFNIKSKHVLFSSATPMDKPTGAVYFMSQILGLSEDDIYNRLGLQVSTYRDKDGVSKKKVTLLKGTSPQQVSRRLQGLALTAIREGAMLRREFPFWGTIEEVAIIPDNIAEILAEEAEIKSYWEGRPRTAGQMLNELRRWNESKKVEEIWKLVMDELAAGRKVVVFANFYTQSLINGLGREVPMFITLFMEKAESMGIPIAKLWSAHNVTTEREKFQNGEVSIALGTFGSAATGVQADDRFGNEPRTLILVTPPYAGDLMQQAIGRVSRKLSQSAAKVIVVYMPGTSDSHAMGIMKKKIMTLEAMQKAGAELEALSVTDDFLTEVGGEPEAGSTELVKDAAKINDLNTKQLDAETFLVYGTGTYHNRHAIKALGGRFNGNHKGWVFPIEQRAQIERELGIREEAKFSIAPERGRSYSRVTDSGRGKTTPIEEMFKRKAKENETVEAMKPEEREKYMAKRKAKVLKMAAFLNKVFPKIKLRIVSKAEFYSKFKTAIDAGRVKLDSIGGVKEGDEVWLNIDAMVTNELTAVHEFAHVFTAIMKEYMNKTYMQGLALVEGTVYHQYALATHSGVYKTPEDYLEEALVLAIEDMGSQILSRTLYMRFVDWARKTLNRIGRRIGFVKGLSLADMSLNDFTRLVADRMLSGSEISLKGDVSDEIYAQMQIFGEPIEAPDVVAKRSGGILANPRFSYIGVANIFSNKSKEVIKNAYKMALTMVAQGKTSEEIRIATGWFKNPYDKKWRYEIGDREMSFKNDEESLLKISQATEANPLKLSDVINHDKLFALFPELKDIYIIYKQGDTNYHASMRSDGNRITVALPFFSVTTGQQLAILLHEIQHGIQIREGFAMGASPEQMTDILANLVDARAKAMQPLLRQTEYPLAFIRIGEYYNSLKEILGNKEAEAIFEKTYRTTVQAEIDSIEEKINGYDSAGIVDYQGRSAREYLGKNGSFYSVETRRAAATRLQYADVFMDNENLNRKYRAVSTSAPLSAIREMYYMATAGEIEARDVEARMFMTDEERQDTPPFSTEDYESDEAITYFGTDEDADFAEDLVGFNGDEKSKFSIIGETGAARMQNAAAIIADLSVAKDMTNAGKDAKTVRLATGWERGVDGKWRYEVPDIQPKIDLDEIGGFADRALSVKEGVNLEQIMEAPELFAAYPQLRWIKVVYDRTMKSAAAWNYLKGDGFGQISVNPENSIDIHASIVHEVQHAIQRIEGFAVGGNLMSSYPIYKDYANILFIIEELSKLPKITVSAAKKLAAKSEYHYEMQYWNKAIEHIQKGVLTKERVEEIQLARRPVDYYLRIAGEVEARNTEARLRMTPEERRSTLLQETEDVAREQQIVLMDAVEGKFSITPDTNWYEKYDMAGAISRQTSPSGITAEPIKFSITPTTTPAGTSTARFSIPNGVEISEYLGSQERNAYHGALSTMNHASIIAQMRTDLDDYVQAYITNNIGTAKKRAMLANFYDDPIMLEVAQTITDPFFTPSKEAERLYRFIFDSDTEKPSGNLFGAINHYRLNENYSFLGVHEKIDSAADIADVETQQKTLNDAKSGVTRFILNRKKYLITGKRYGKYLQQQMIDLFNFTTVSKWFSTTTGTLAKFDQLIKARNLIAGKLKARNNQLFELAIEEFSRLTSYRGVNNYTSVKKIEVLNARDGKLYKMPVDYVISLIQMHESFVDHWARHGKKKVSPLIDNPSSGETDGFVFQDFDDPTIQRILRLDDAEYLRLQDEINNNPEYSTMYRRVETLLNRYDIFDYLSQTYSHHTGLKLPRVAKYFPLTAITDPNAEMELRNITGLLEETSIIQPRTGPAKQYRLMGAMSAMKAHYETVEDFVQNQEVILNISNYLNKNEKSLIADKHNQPELIEYLTNFMKDINNWRRQVYEQNKDQQKHINIPKLLSKFALSRFAWNFGMPLIQAFGYFPALMQGIIKDKYLILAGKDLAYLISRAYTDSLLLAGEKEKLPILPISTGEAKLMEEIRHNVFASELYLRLHQTNPDVDLTPLTEINPRSASTIAGAAMQTWNWLINTVADKYGMSFMRRGDRAPILSFYKAAQYQFDAENTGGVLDGMVRDEWVADKATKLMYATNQLYPINQRTGFQRRKDLLSKMIGLFSGQQQKQLNLALQSYADYLVSPTTENKWRLTGAIGFGIIFSAFGTAFVHALMKGLRDSMKPGDDDDDEKRGELLFDYFRTDLMRNLAGNIPGWKAEIFNTIVSLLDKQYWSDKPVDIPPITAITELAGGVAKVMSGMTMDVDGSIKSEYEQAKAIHMGLTIINRNFAQLTGIPFEFARQFENTVLYNMKPEKPRAKSKKAF